MGWHASFLSFGHDVDVRTGIRRKSSGLKCFSAARPWPLMDHAGSDIPACIIFPKEKRAPRPSKATPRVERHRIVESLIGLSPFRAKSKYDCLISQAMLSGESADRRHRELGNRQLVKIGGSELAFRRHG
jgi:hypothetical protein